MKSLLVDALRAANESDSEFKTGDSASALNPAEHSPTEDVDVASQLAVELELMESEVAVLDEAVVLPRDTEFDPANDHSKTRMLELSVSGVSGDASMFERLAVWSPLACLLLAALSIAAFSGWSRVAGGEHSADLQVFTAQPYTPGARQIDFIDVALAKRFSFTETDVHSAPAKPISNAPVPVGADDSRITIDRNTLLQRQPAGVTDADEKTFTSLASAYNAYLSGEVSRIYIERVLLSRIEEHREDTELDINLLLQRHADAAPLHFALGTLLARDSRWPEARIAFARANELNAESAGSSLQ